MRTGRLDNRGRLQMLKIKRPHNLNLAAASRAGARYQVEWVDIDDPAPSFPYTPGQPAPTPNDTALTHVSRQGWAQGAAYFSRLEGTVYDRGRRVLHVHPGRRTGRDLARPDRRRVRQRQRPGVGRTTPGRRTLSLVYQSPGPDVLDFPDNVTTSPRGTLVVCEDNINDNYLRGLTPDGELFDIALNRLVSSPRQPPGSTTSSPAPRSRRTATRCS